jgi:integrase
VSPRKKIVSELLGHSNMAITQQSYGKIIQKEVVREVMNNTAKRLNINTWVG